MPYHAFLTTLLGANFGDPLLWKSWKEALLILMVIVSLSLGVMRPDLSKAFLRAPLTLLVLAYALLHIIVALLAGNPLEPTLAGLMTNLRFLALFLVAQLILLAAPLKAESLRTLLTKVLIVSTVIISIFGLLQVSVLPKDFLTPFGYDEELSIAPYILIDEQEGALRAFSTLRGPNTLGMFLLLPIAILLVYVYRRRRLAYTLPALVLAVLTVFATGSRSAWIGMFVVFALVGLVLLGQDRALRFARRWGVAVLAVVTLLIVAAFEYPPLRLAIFHSNPDDTHLTEGSTDAHIEATIDGAEDALANPLGRGPGQAGPASFYATSPRIAENYYVQVSQEVGVLGLMLFLAISFIVARKLWRASKYPHAPPLVIGLMASFWGIAVVNILLHGWADDPTALVWWGLAGLTLAIGLDSPQGSATATAKRRRMLRR